MMQEARCEKTNDFSAKEETGKMPLQAGSHYKAAASSLQGSCK